MSTQAMLPRTGSVTTHVSVSRKHEQQAPPQLPAQVSGQGMLFQSTGITVMELIRQYWEHAIIYYRLLDGSQTGEVDAVRQSLRPLARLFGDVPADLIGPKRLKQVREEMIALGWCRNQVNQQVGRIKRMYRWGVENELVAPSVYHGLQAVAGLKMGRTLAPEGDPVKPVPLPLIEAALVHVSRQVGTMIRLQLLTGMRPGEVLIMRTCDIDRSDTVWVYRPSHHKTEHHHHTRTVFLGPQAKELIKPFINELCPGAFLFSAADADQERRAEQHKQRKTPMNEGNVPGSNCKKRPQKTPGDRYRGDSYRRAIKYALLKAFPVPPGLSPQQADQWRHEHHWHPHQLRHNAATQLRKDFGIDAAQTILGHKSLAVTQVYAEKDEEAAVKIMRQVG